MPRGGRGGSSGGARGGGRPKPGTARVGGVEIPVDEDVKDAVPLHQPGELFPKRDLKPFRPLSKDEKTEIAAYISMRDQIREGPLFTVLGEDDLRAKDYAVLSAGLRTASATGSGGGAYGAAGAAVFVADPFENGVPMHSHKYVPKKRRLPEFESGKCVLKFFPPELWGVLDPRYASASSSGSGRHGSGGPARKKKKLSKEDEAARTKAKLDSAAKRAAEGEDVDGDDDEAAGDEHSEDEDQDRDAAAAEGARGRDSDADDDFDEFEDDMGGDYNAEQYFDDGGDDAGDDYDGGDGGGDDGMF